MQEQAAGGADGGLGGMADMAGMADMMGLGGMDMAKIAEAMNDPETLKAFEQMGGQMAEAMKGLSKMTPEELTKQMEEAMKMLTQDDLVDSILENRDEVLKQVEESGTVPPEELAKFKADPAYFELKMRESFEQMQGLFEDPDMMKTMAEAMSGMQDMMNDPNMLTEMLGDFTSDEKIEEARLELLSGQNPALTAMFDSEEMQAILKDSKKFRETVKEGQEGMMGDEL